MKTSQFFIFFILATVCLPAFGMESKPPRTTMRIENPARKKLRKPLPLLQEVLKREAYKALSKNERLLKKEERAIRLAIRQDFENCLWGKFDTTSKQGLSLNAISKLSEGKKGKLIEKLKKRNAQLHDKFFWVCTTMHKLITPKAYEEITRTFLTATSQNIDDVLQRIVVMSSVIDATAFAAQHKRRFLSALVWAATEIIQENSHETNKENNDKLPKEHSIV